MTVNPWVRTPDDEPLPVDEPSALNPPPATASHGQGVAHGGIVLPAANDRFGVRSASGPAAAVWWVGAHGGAGESTLEQLLKGSRAAHHAWPLVDEDAPPATVALVARTNASGLRAAQLVATEWATGTIAVDLLGLVLIADAPGRLPGVLRDFVRLVSGAVPAVWQVPWVETWRTGEPVTTETAPRAVRRVLDDVYSRVARG